MKKILVLTGFVFVLTFSLCNQAIAGNGPAPNSGDGVPDGSGWLDKGKNLDDKGAPNSGDGIPDGSGW